VLTDAHIHLADLLERDPRFPERLAASLDHTRDSRASFGSRWTCCAASHDPIEWEKTEALRDRLPPFVSSFGIHPQWAVRKHADFLSRLAAQGRIAAIGEAGFDFFGDAPERVRNEANESAQREVFEFQLDLAERFGLPLLLHLRKAMDLAFAYAPRLGRLPAAVFHSFPGSADDAASLIAKGVNAYFSFGAPILNGNKRAAAACASVPEDRLLAETDAPWQPPRRALRGGGALYRGAMFCRAEDIGAIIGGVAALRGLDPEAIEAIVTENFARAYGPPPPSEAARPIT
jgi:TatD DNase family protein